jgi:hypothetical protein
MTFSIGKAIKCMKWGTSLAATIRIVDLATKETQRRKFMESFVECTVLSNKTGVEHKNCTSDDIFTG